MTNVSSNLTRGNFFFLSPFVGHKISNLLGKRGMAQLKMKLNALKALLNDSFPECTSWVVQHDGDRIVDVGGGWIVLMYRRSGKIVINGMGDPQLKGEIEKVIKRVNGLNRNDMTEQAKRWPLLLEEWKKQDELREERRKEWLAHEARRKECVGVDLPSIPTFVGEVVTVVEEPIVMEEVREEGWEVVTPLPSSPTSVADEV